MDVSLLRRAFAFSPTLAVAIGILLTAVTPLEAQPGRLFRPDTGLSGDRQEQVQGHPLPHPLRVQVVDTDGRPLPGQTVRFVIVETPEAGPEARVVPAETVSDSAGIASAILYLGDAPGDYAVAIRLSDGLPDGDLLVYSATARARWWWAVLIATMAGGLGIFLYGMMLMSEGMKKSAGSRLRAILGRLTDNRFVAVGVGAFVTMVIQSSSATTVMLVSFVEARLMTFAQSLGIILGADIGTTVTAQLIAFKLTDWALPLIAVGAAFTFLGRVETVRHVGEAVLGFGFLFFGMAIMSGAMEPLRSLPAFLNLLVSLENPLLGILAGAVFTALIQSSSAFTGILIVLATQGLITLEAAIPMLFGANVGTCVTAALAALNTRHEARRVALAHILFKLVGVVLFVGWIPAFADLVRWISPMEAVDGAGVSIPRQIANAHTIFNVALTAIMLPFTRQAAGLIERLLPIRPEPPAAPPAQLDPGLVRTPALAITLAHGETVTMGRLTAAMLRDAIAPFTHRDAAAMGRIERAEARIDRMENAISAYLTRISQQRLTESQADEAFQMMYVVTEFEQIADIIAKNLRPRARKWLAAERRFSEAGRADLERYHRKCVDQVERAVASFESSDLHAARRLKRKGKAYKQMADAFRRAHFERLREDIPETVASSEVHRELIEQFKLIHTHATNIARILLADGRNAGEATPRGGERPD